MYEKQFKKITLHKTNIAAVSPVENQAAHNITRFPVKWVYELLQIKKKERKKERRKKDYLAGKGKDRTILWVICLVFVFWFLFCFLSSIGAGAPPLTTAKL